MPTKITATAVYQVKSETSPDVSAYISKISEICTADGSASLTTSYSADKTRLSLSFEFPNHDVMDKISHDIGPILGKLSETARLDQVHVVGDVKEGARKAFESLGTEVHIAAA